MTAARASRYAVTHAGTLVAAPDDAEPLLAPRPHRGDDACRRAPGLVPRREPTDVPEVLVGIEPDGRGQPECDATLVRPLEP